MESFKLTRSVFACSAVLSVLGAMTMIACSDESSSQLPTKPMNVPKPSSTAEETEPEEEEEMTPEKRDSGADAGRVCKLRKPGAGVYCPFQVRVDAGPDGGAPSQYCAAGEMCCGFTTAQGAMTDGSAPPPSYCASSCEPSTAQPPFISQPWECTAPEHCGSSQKCCIFAKAGASGLSINTERDANKCPAQNFGRVGGTACRDTCEDAETSLCSEAVPCQGDAKCVSISATGRDLGYCK